MTLPALQLAPPHGPPAPDPIWNEVLRLVESRAAGGLAPDLDAAALAIVRAKLAEVEGRGGRRFEVLSTSDIFAPLAPRDHPIRGLAMAPGPPALFLSFAFGGKSVVLQDLLLSVAAGTPIWGHFRPASEEGARVLHIDYEQGEETRDRYQRLARGRFERVDIQRLVDAGNLGLVSLPPVFLNSPDAEEVYKRALDGRILSFVDTFAASLPGVEENESAVGEHLYRLGRVSGATGCVIIVAHHMGKAALTPARGSSSGSGADPRTLARGSTAIVAAAGYVYAMGGAKNEPKLVQQAKARGLGDPHVDDFYLELATRDVREELGYFNPQNPADPGGFTVRYRTVEQVKPPKVSKAEDLEADCAAVLRYIQEQNAKGLPIATKSSPAKPCRLRKGDCLDAVKTLVARGLVEDRGKRGSTKLWATNRLPIDPA